MPLGSSTSASVECLGQAAVLLPTQPCRHCGMEARPLPSSLAVSSYLPSALPGGEGGPDAAP